MPSIVPFVDEELKKHGLTLQLQPDNVECHPGKPSNAHSSGDIGQTCRWATHDADRGSYRLLSVSVVLWDDSAEARQQIQTNATQQQIAPKAAGLGDEAIVGAAQAPDKPVTIRGREESLALTGADVAARFHNMSIGVLWLGADYTVDAHGVPRDETGIARETATQEGTAIAQAILGHIR